MMSYRGRSVRVVRWIAIAAMFAGFAAQRVRAADDDAEALFVRHVGPLFKARCVACHGEDEKKIKAKFDMRTRALLLKGGESGEPAIIAGKPDESPLFLAVSRKSDDWSAMPPKENDKLSAQEIVWIRKWIAGGAPWPNETRAAEIARQYANKWATEDGVTVKTSGGLSTEWTNRRYKPENLWAYQPLRKPTPPEGVVAAQSQSHSAVDAFIDAKMRTVAVAPAPIADRRTLIRRATFDLIGLPPTPREIDDFVSDPATDDEAFAKVVDRLLASPHYGEQWGRHWLDVVRYADSSGYANDYERGSAWRYRDYIVRAFNDDVPYDRFIREQIAGDEIDANDPRMLVAVGFLRMGPWELTGMEVAKVARQRYLDDVTDAVGEVFLGHMLQCARCHDHKFDPVPTRDYYSIQAAFATTQLAERPAAFLKTENTGGFEEMKYLDQRRAYYRKALRELDVKAIDRARAWYKENAIDATAFEAAISELLGAPGQRGRDVGYEDIRRALSKRGVPEDRIPPKHAGFTAQDYGMERVARKGLERLGWVADRYEPIALSVYSGRTPELKNVYEPLRMPDDRMTKGELEETCILAVGDPFSPKDHVAPGVLSVANTLGAPSLADDTIANDIVGRRAALADWIASPRNPLTARVIVNRVWQWHFGRAIAGNPNNFGATGKKPTHPELLDWLAATLIEDGWSIKALHRRIMLSQAYRRSTTHPDAAVVARKDADGASYAAFRPRRLDAEELRDAMLRVTDELNPAIGGIPVRPEMNREAALQPRMVMGTFAEAWQPSPLPAQRHRRSLYALRLRGQRDPFFEVFNAPAGDAPCEAREASTVTPQVFAMFNSEISYDRALAFAARLLKDTSSREAAIDRAFALALGRHATDAEAAQCLAHWDRMTARHKRLHFDKPTYPREVVRDAVEENTGERFTFVEPLEAYADFVPDLKPSDVDPEVRGLAEVCLVLLNANEFAYVY